MLILARKVGEEIQIGEGPNAVILRIEEIPSVRLVRLSFKAPRSVLILRKELVREDPNPGESK